MSRMYKPAEVAAWLSEVVGTYGPVKALRIVRNAAEDQRINLEDCKRAGSFPGDMRRDEYEESVKILHDSLPELEARATLFTLDQEAAEENRQRLDADYRYKCAQKHKMWFR